MNSTYKVGQRFNYDNNVGSKHVRQQYREIVILVVRSALTASHVYDKPILEYSMGHNFPHNQMGSNVCSALKPIIELVMIRSGKMR